MIITVEDDYVEVVARHVKKGQRVRPGAPLLDVRRPGGVVETIFAVGWGIVGFIVGKKVHRRTFADMDEQLDLCTDDESDWIRLGAALASVYAKGMMLCQIILRVDNGSAKKTGLHPRPSWTLLQRRLGMMPILR